MAGNARQRVGCLSYAKGIPWKMATVVAAHVGVLMFAVAFIGCCVKKKMKIGRSDENLDREPQFVTSVAQ